MSGTHDAVVLGRTLPTTTNIGLSLGTPIMVMLMLKSNTRRSIESWLLETKYNSDLDGDDGEEEQKAGFF